MSHKDDLDKIFKKMHKIEALCKKCKLNKKKNEKRRNPR